MKTLHLSVCLCLICFFISSIEKHSTDPSVFDNSSGCFLCSSKYCFYLRFIFPDSVKMVPCSSLAYVRCISTSYIYLHLLSSFDKFVYYLCSFSRIQFNPSYFSSSLAIVTAIYGLLFFVLISMICSERIFFSGDSTSGVFVPP